jgi:hypothetical protein
VAAVLRAELDGARQLADALRGTVAALEARAGDLSAALDAERERARVAEAERDALRGAAAVAGLPWWRRLLGVTSTPPADPGEA